MSNTITKNYRNINSSRERRIRINRIRRRREMRKNFLIGILTLCLIITCTISFCSFRSNAKTEHNSSTKYYKSISIAADDTLWSIAEEYMDSEHYDSIHDYIKEIMKINSVKDERITYGACLVIPYYK